MLLTPSTYLLAETVLVKEAWDKIPRGTISGHKFISGRIRSRDRLTKGLELGVPTYLSPVGIESLFRIAGGSFKLDLFADSL